MANITSAQLASEFRRFLAEGMGYVWGLNGELYTKELAEHRAKNGYSVPSGRSKSTYFTVDCAKWTGKRCADCSGGIVYAMRQYDPDYSDRTADTFKTQFTECGDIKALPEIPGLALWRSGHIGVYVGGGECVEFRGTDYGCVKTNVKDRNFTHWGKLAGVDYSGSTESPKEPETAPQAASREAFYAVVTGGNYYVRVEPNTRYDPVATARKSDKLLAMPEENGWHRVALPVAGDFTLGYISAKAALREVTL